ncbi:MULTISPECIES: spore germination protein [unclassified Paenibacillus]|uniref:spore germination protein n=1 Tax=unclassified Paenibacillus TaxID=185978 RepID=UPI00363BE8DF
MTNDPTYQTQLQPAVRNNLACIRSALGQSEDLIIRELSIGPDRNIPVGIAYMEGLAEALTINDFMMNPLMYKMNESDIQMLYGQNEKNEPGTEYELSLPIANLKKSTDFQALLSLLLTGSTLLFIEGITLGFAADTRGSEERAISEPKSQSVIRGPQEGFTETAMTNIALIRKRLNDPNLWVKKRQIGTVSKTCVSVVYLNGIADDHVVHEVNRRLDHIKIDAILEGAYVEELIQDETFSPFPTVFNTERPDVAAAGLLEGRIAIIIDGSPFILMVPALFVQYFQSAEDYYHRSDFGLLRLLRFAAYFYSMMAPSLYIAVSTFHQEVLPANLLISLASQREGVPLPAFIEAIIMIVAFEILYEAGIRMPKAVGTAVSIVGALVLGQAAVEAGLVSAAMVIVVASTAISNFIIPTYDGGQPIRILRFVFMLLSASFGMFGIFVGTITLLLHLCSLRSFGVPYMTSLAPYNMANVKDTIFRFPWWAMRTRPILLSENAVRSDNSPPQPES